MEIRIGFDMTFQTSARLPMNFLLYVHPSREADLHESDVVHVETGMASPLTFRSWATALATRWGEWFRPADRCDSGRAM